MRMMILAAALAALPLPAAAQTVTAKDPAALVKLLQTKGYRAELVQGESGPYIRSSDSGLNFSLFFMNCEAKVDCKTVQYYVGFNDMKDLPLARINEWNKKRRFARAYIDDDKDPVLEMDVDLENGLSTPAFLESLSIWTGSMNAYRDFLNEKG